MLTMPATSRAATPLDHMKTPTAIPSLSSLKAPTALSIPKIPKTGLVLPPIKTVAPPKDLPKTEDVKLPEEAAVAAETPVETKAEEVAVVPPVEEAPVEKQEEAAVPEETATEELSATEEAKPEEAQQEPETEEKPKKKRRAAAKIKTDEPSAQAEEEVELPESVLHHPTSSTADAILKELCPNVNIFDVEWDNQIKAMEEGLDKSRIDKNVTPAIVPVIISELAWIYDTAQRNLGVINGHHEVLAGSVSVPGKIERVMKTASIGSNTEERKKSGILAASSYKLEDGSRVNFFDVKDYIVKQKYRCEAILRTVEFRQRQLQTLVGNQKTKEHLA